MTKVANSERIRWAVWGRPRSLWRPWPVNSSCASPFQQRHAIGTTAGVGNYPDSELRLDPGTPVLDVKATTTELLSQKQEPVP